MPTLFDKIFASHIVRDLGDGWALLHIDRHLLHDLSGPPALESVASRGLALADPELVWATVDHAVSSAPGRTGMTFPAGGRLWRALKTLSQEADIPFFDVGADGQGIVHVMGPELGLVLPGCTLICSDSHTCTNGALGALAFGVGQTESAHALATSTLRVLKPKQMRITLEGRMAPGVTSKDLILHLIGKLGVAAGVGQTIEFSGPAVAAMSIEARLTLCNLSVELGARCGIIAPDDKTFDYLRGRRFAPQGEAFERARAAWRDLHSDADALFDREYSFDITAVPPTVTWGVTPAHALAIDGRVPDPAAASDVGERAAITAALEYMDLEAGQPIAGTPVDWVFIGSCANSRITDLRAAAAVVRGRYVAPGVTAWVVPGSMAVKREAEAEGLDQVFTGAGFHWREPGCSMCVAANGERVPPGARSVSTSNRNFIGRQGPRARTHLASPAMAAAAAVTGEIFDVRRL
jgi:3-isopropylmalate/(R)-2-methylmalate dehydratase large subunit